MSFKSGYVGLVGRTNSGKSSLVNALVGENFSIVSHKPQTTRKRTLGIITKEGKSQVIFVDTPGVIEKAIVGQGLNKFLDFEVEEALRDVDIVIVCLSPQDLKMVEPTEVFANILKSSKPKFAVLTKIDKFKSHEIILPSWVKELNPIGTSAHEKIGLEKVLELVEGMLTEGPQYYDGDIYTTQNMREISAEIVRKQCFDNLFQEIPYGLLVQINNFEENNPKILRIEGDIVVVKESHKGMVIGERGSSLKKIGTLAREEIEKIVGRKVFLRLEVKTKPNWFKNPQLLKELDYTGRGN